MIGEKEMELSNKQRTLVMVPVLLGGFAVCLNETLLNVAFPQLMSSLHVSMGTVQWLATAYMLIIGILVPVAAFLLETFKTEKLYMTAMIIFTIGTVLCGLAQSFPLLLIFRIVQAIGSGLMIPIIMYTILALYPPEKRGAAMGISMLVVVLAPALGPTLSGLVLQNLNWHWLFWSIIPVALICILLGFLYLRNVSSLAKPKFDVPSIILSTIGFGGLLYGISSVATAGFFNPVVIISLVCGIGCLIVFTFRQIGLKQPMLNLQIFRFPMFALGTVITFISFMMPFAVNIILPTYMQDVLGITPFAAGLALLPGGICCSIILPIAGHLYDKIGAKPLAIIGFAVVTTGMFFLSRISASTNLSMLIILHVCMTSGIALLITPVQTNSLNQLSKEHNAHGVTLLNTTQQISAAFGSTLFIGLLAAVQAKSLSGLEVPSVEQQHTALVSGADTAFTAALIIAVAGLILSFFIRRREAESCLIQNEHEGVSDDSNCPLAVADDKE
jgi:DHA2 family lincomycin resistance protein-like MFS transporter